MIINTIKLTWVRVKVIVGSLRVVVGVSVRVSVGVSVGVEGLA